MEREWDVTLHYNTGGEYCTTRWRMWELVEHTASNPARALGEAIRDQLVPLLQECMSLFTTIDYVYARVVLGDRVNPFSTIVNVVGNFPQDSLPVNSVVVITWYADKPFGNGRVRRRSNGFSGCPENFQRSGLLNSAGLTSWEGFAEQLFQGVAYTGVGGGRWVPIFPGNDDAIERQVRLIVVRPNLASKRTRRRRIGVV